MSFLYNELPTRARLALSCSRPSGKSSLLRTERSRFDACRSSLHSFFWVFSFPGTKDICVKTQTTTKSSKVAFRS